MNVSSSDGSLSQSEMNIYSLPTATTPRPADNTEVLSQRIPDQGETVLETAQGKIPDARHMGGKIPIDYADESRSKLGSQPDTAPEPPKVPDSGRQPLAKEGEPPVPMTSVHPEASDNLLEALPALPLMRSTVLL